MFADDPQMTMIMRHLKEFSGAEAASVTNPSGEAIEFPLRIRLSTLNQTRKNFSVGEMSFAAMSFVSLPLFDPQPETITAHSRPSTAASLPPGPSPFLPLA